MQVLGGVKRSVAAGRDGYMTVMVSCDILGGLYLTGVWNVTISVEEECSGTYHKGAQRWPLQSG